MEESNKLLGLGLFGEAIIRLIDQGKTEPLDTIIQKMNNNELVSYLSGKYDLEPFFSIGVYNEDALNEFFLQNSVNADSSRTGVFNQNNGLLSVLSIILAECEYQIPKW